MTRNLMAAAAMLTIAAAPVLSQQDPGVVREQFSDWMYECSDELCQVFTSLADSATGSLEVSMSVVWDARAGAASAVVSVPMGTALVPGMRLWVTEDAAQVVPFQVCEADGCRAVLAVDESMERALGAAEHAFVEYVPYRVGRKVTRQLSLEGFGAAMTRLKSSLAD